MRCAENPALSTLDAGNVASLGFLLHKVMLRIHHIVLLHEFEDTSSGV